MTKDKKTLTKINDFYNSEMAAHNKYLNYASYLDGKNVLIYGSFLSELAKDKTDAHMTRTFKYLSSFEFPANITERCAVKGMQFEKYNKMELRDACLEIFEDVLKTELALRDEIGKIAVESLKDYDVETFNYTQWFVNDSLKDIGDVENVLFSLRNTNLLLGEKHIK